MNNRQRLAIQFCRLLVDGFAHAACDKSIINSVIINESIHTLIKIKCIRSSLKDTKIHDKNEEPPMRRCFQCNSELLNREKNILNAVGALLDGFFRGSSSFLAFLNGLNKKRFIVGTFSPKSDQKNNFLMTRFIGLDVPHRETPIWKLYPTDSNWPRGVFLCVACRTQHRQNVCRDKSHQKAISLHS